MMKIFELLAIIFFLISTNLYAQNDTTNVTNGNIYQDLSKQIDIRDAKFILVLNNETFSVDTTVLNKVDPDWVESVNVTTEDPMVMNSKVSSVEIYIRKKYKKDIERIIVGK